LGAPRDEWRRKITPECTFDIDMFDRQRLD
jgi:hypothetical protein